MNLDSMKYAELRSLAKELGLKANMKADKLLKAIKQHYEQEKNEEEEKQGQEEDATSVQAVENGGQETKDAPCEEEVSVPSVFVNTRRGKGGRTKRKISESAAECDAELPPSAAEADTKVDESSAPRGAKKRKVSSTKDSDATETPDEPQTTGTEQQQPDAKDEAAVHGKEPKVARTGRIPRYQGSQQKSKTLKPVTPNFKKLHEAHFNKMESIDSYVQRKTNQIQTYRNSVKELKKLADKTKLQQVCGKPQVKANRTSIFSPIPKAAEDKHRQTLPSATKAPPSKPAEKTDALFRPSVLSTRRINVRFSEATHNNENKTSMVKTPARRSLCASSTPQKATTDGTKPNNNKASTTTKTPGPFVFTGNTSISATPGTQKKPTFDLKASLSRPLTYKPYTGKLKPFGGENTENNPGNASTIGSHQKNYKQHQVQTRGDRRAKHKEDRKQKKENLLGARRGLVMM